MRGRVVMLAGLVAACGEPTPCLDREFFRDRSNLYAVARLPGGYVVDDRTRLVGYDDDDVERFAVDVVALAFAGTRDGRLTTLAIDGEALVLEQWSADGAPLGELARAVVGPEAREHRDTAITADGAAFASGDTTTGSWWVELQAGRDAVVTRSDSSARSEIAPAPDGDAYVLESTWHDEFRAYEHVTLTRVGPGDTPRWSSTVYDHLPDTPRGEQTTDLWAAAGAAHVVTFDEAQSVFVIRRYRPDGELEWTRVESRTTTHPPGRPVASDDGTLLWVDDSGASIRVRALDEAGAVVHECTAPADGNRLSDVELDGDELFVVTIDRITRLRIGAPLR